MIKNEDTTRMPRRVAHMMAHDLCLKYNKREAVGRTGQRFAKEGSVVVETRSNKKRPKPK